MSSHHWKNNLRIASAVAALSLWAWPAGAQNTLEDPCLRDARCQELLVHAQAASQEQQYEDALKTYREAYSRSSAPWLLVNIGRMHHKLGRYQEAKKSYTRYLASTRQPGDDEQRATAIDFLHQTENQLAPSLAAPVAANSDTNASQARQPVYKKWWFWTLVGGAAAAVVVGTAVGVSARQPDLSGVMQYRLMP